MAAKHMPAHPAGSLWLLVIPVGRVAGAGRAYAIDPYLFRVG